MTSRLISFGCSFIWGTDLPDYRSDDFLRGYSNLTWPALLAKKFGLEYFSRAQGGLGNLSITDRVCCYANLFSDDLVIINWTFIDRFDYSNPLGAHFNNGTQDFIACCPGNNDDVSEFYFRNLHSEYRDKLTALMYIKTCLDYLLSKNVPFIMTAVDDLLWCQQWHAPDLIRELQQQIRPYIHDFEGKNFLEWSRNKGFKFSDHGHPLEEAHIAAADLMVPLVHDLLNNKNNRS
jgi:hypothetical protein